MVMSTESGEDWSGRAAFSVTMQQLLGWNSGCRERERAAKRSLKPQLQAAFDEGDEGGEFGCTVTRVNIISDIVPAHAKYCMMCAVCSGGCDVVCCAV